MLKVKLSNSKKVSKLSDAKVKEGIAFGPQIATRLKSGTVKNQMSFKEKKAWQSFCEVVEGFLGKRKDCNNQN